MRINGIVKISRCHWRAGVVESSAHGRNLVAGNPPPPSGMAASLNGPPVLATVTKFGKLQAKLLQVNSVLGPLFSGVAPRFSDTRLP